MKSVLLIAWMAWLAVSATAQDFASRFLIEHKADSNLTCVTISPKMMEEILKTDAGKDEAVVDIISSLKSMQMLTSQVEGKKYYEDALKLVEKNPGRFEPFLSFEDSLHDCRIMVRKKNEAIIELVMLVREKSSFSVINFTGTMSAAFISALTAPLKQKRS